MSNPTAGLQDSEPQKPKKPSLAMTIFQRREVRAGATARISPEELAHMARYAIDEETRRRSIDALWKIIEPRVEQSLRSWLRWAVEQSTVDSEDFVLDAYLLCEHVVDRFDKTQGVKFWTFYSKAWRWHARRIAKSYAKDYVQPKSDEVMFESLPGISDIMSLETLVEALVPTTTRNRDLKILMWKYKCLDGWTLQELCDQYGHKLRTIHAWIVEIDGLLLKAIADSERDS